MKQEIRRLGAMALADWRGFTLVELMIAIAVLAILAAICVPAYSGYLERARNSQATRDIADIRVRIEQFADDNKAFPASLGDIGASGRVDPWGRAYVYGNHALIPSGQRRKDHSLVPINSNYDLYSTGKDGQSSPPLTAQHSRDDIVLAGDGRFIGLASEY